MTPVQKRSSWSAPAKMTAAELATANLHLMTRLKPFMANPMTDTPISAFFYSEQASRQQTVYTDASGHFTFKAALDFLGEDKILIMHLLCRVLQSSSAT